MDWKKEKLGLRKPAEKLDWWKPTAGVHKVTFLSDGEEFTTNFEGKDINKVRFEIDIGQGPMSWGVAKGETKNSLFGQLALIGATLPNGLLGQQITLIVKGVGKDKDYTIQEALHLMTDEEVVTNK